MNGLDFQIDKGLERVRDQSQDGKRRIGDHQGNIQRRDRGTKGKEALGPARSLAFTFA